MGIYLGQLPPAEFARFKAELAETLIANFSYPRFFDHRTNSLRMRPVDRNKRQEVWLYLSSFDFTSWSRVDLTSPDFQRYVERLFIQFVQRNRSFFGEQGRKRMADVRMLIGTSSASVVQGLRAHLKGQKLGNHAFGSPLAVPNWSARRADNGVAEPSWEQISAVTLALQQQLQEMRGEPRTALPADSKASSNGNSGSVRSSEPPQPLHGVVNTGQREGIPPSPIVSTSTPPPHNNRQAAPEASMSEVKGTVAPGDSQISRRQPGTSPQEQTTRGHKSEPLHHSGNLAHMSASSPETISSIPTQTWHMTYPPSAPASGNVTIGEDDVAIFEQLRHQMLLWLRIQVIRSGIELAGQSPSQLLDALRQQARIDETRLQVVSTLLNLSNQVIKTGQVSILDYKQALMFHLMHTRD